MIDTDMLKKLLAERIESRLAFQNTQAVNTAFLTLDQRLELDIASKKAFDRFIEAERAYNEAIAKVVKESQHR